MTNQSGLSVTPEPPAPSLAAACERLGIGLKAFEQAAAETLNATAEIRSGADIPRLSAALDDLAARVVEVQRAVASYRGLATMAQRGYEERQRLQN